MPGYYRKGPQHSGSIPPAQLPSDHHGGGPLGDIEGSNPQPRWDSKSAPCVARASVAVTKLTDIYTF